MAPALATAALGVVAAFEEGPLGFLPHLLRWPLVVAFAGAIWLPRLKVRERLPPWSGAVAEGVSLTLVFGTYLLLKVIGLHATDTDDNIYFYMARRFAQGALPYRDFFFAHPPIHLVVPALVFKITGFSIPVAKSIPAVAQALAGLFLYLAIRRSSRSVALAALLMHLTAYEVLMGATEMDGENLMTAFLAAAVLLAVRGRPLASGACAGLALGTGLYSLAGALALLVAHAGSSRRALAWYAVGLAGCVGLWIGVFAGIGGAVFWDGVFRYHLAKAPSGDHLPLFSSANPLTFLSAYLHDLKVFLAGRVFVKSAFWHSSLFVAATLGIGLAMGPALAQPAAAGAPLRKGWRKLLASLLSGTPQGLALLGGVSTVLFLLQWAALNEVYDFYLVPMLALMGAPAGYALVTIAVKVRAANTPARLLLPGVLAGVFGLHSALAHEIHDQLWPEEARDQGQIARYTWRDPAALVGPAQLTRLLLFQDQRTKGEPHPPYRHYLWNKSLSFSLADEIAGHVRATSGPEETLTGASTPTPLVALLAGRRIAADEADTNNKRFRSGFLSDRSFWEKVCADQVRFVLAAPRSRFTEEFMERNPTARQYFARDRVFNDPNLRHFRSERFVLYRRRDAVSGLPAGQVCSPAEEAAATSR